VAVGLQRQRSDGHRHRRRPRLLRISLPPPCEGYYLYSCGGRQRLHLRR